MENIKKLVGSFTTAAIFRGYHVGLSITTPPIPKYYVLYKAGKQCDKFLQLFENIFNGYCFITAINRLELGLNRIFSFVNLFLNISSI